MAKRVEGLLLFLVFLVSEYPGARIFPCNFNNIKVRTFSANAAGCLFGLVISSKRFSYSPVRNNHASGERMWTSMFLEEQQ